MEIVNFEQKYIQDAKELALANYGEERAELSALPALNHIPDLSMFVENGLGVVAVEEGRVLGFLGCFNPWDHAFDSNACGTFSPIHAHAAVKDNRRRIYQRLYQAAAQKWVSLGITYHAIALYAHDSVALDTFFHYGFGIRCMDAICKLESVKEVHIDGIVFEELAKQEVGQIAGLRKKLSDHMGASPCFMVSSEQDFTRWLESAEQRNSRVFVAKASDKIIAFMEVADEGENFMTESAKMLNICGAFCLPDYRGRGVYRGLLTYVMKRLMNEGYQQLGVDFESFNPTAAGFWLKYFDAYTNSVTRRIDECALL